MRGYFTYEGEPGWYSCHAILENGYCFAGHICSHPNFAPGDLFFGRASRVEVLARLVPEGVEWELMPIGKVPPEVLERNKDKAMQEEWSAKYKSVAKELGQVKGDA